MCRRICGRAAGVVAHSPKRPIYSSALDPGHHLIHELLPVQSAWLHVIYSEVTLLDIIHTQGDGVGVTIESSVALSAQENTETLVDLDPTERSSAHAGVA
jgi:hypothetical protein